MRTSCPESSPYLYSPIFSARSARALSAIRATPQIPAISLARALRGGPAVRSTCQKLPQSSNSIDWTTVVISVRPGAKRASRSFKRCLCPSVSGLSESVASLNSAISAAVFPLVSRTQFPSAVSSCSSAASAKASAEIPKKTKTRRSKPEFSP